MGGDTMSALEEKLQGYEDELTRLRVENEQLRQSSQAFGELAERLSVALRTATRVNRRQATAADSGGRWRYRGEILNPGATQRPSFGDPQLVESASLSAGDRRLRETHLKCPAKHQFGLKHLLLKSLRDGVAVRRLRNGLPEGHSGVVHSCVKLVTHPSLRIPAFASGCGCHQCPEKRFSICLKGFCGILAEFASGRSALSGDPRADPID